MGICRKRHASVEEAEADVRDFLGMAGIRTVSVIQREAETALAAFSRYGKGRGHPAQLNLGDCFAYAVAKTIGRCCCSKARISTRRIFDLPLTLDRPSRPARNPAAGVF